MGQIGSLEEAYAIARDYASEIADGMGIEALRRTFPMFVSDKDISADELSPPEATAIGTFLGELIDSWQDRSQSIAKNIKRSLPATYLTAMIAKGVTGGNFGDKIAEANPAPLMATETRPTDLGLTNWSVAFTAGDVAYLIGSSTGKYIPTQTTGERKFVVLIKDGLVTVDTPTPFDEISVEFDAKNYQPFALNADAKIAIDQSNNKVVYTARLYPTIILPGVGVDMKVKATDTVTTDVYRLGITFYEKTAYSSL